MHLGIFEQPMKIDFFSNLLDGGFRAEPHSLPAVSQEGAYSKVLGCIDLESCAPETNEFACEIVGGL